MLVSFAVSNFRSFAAQQNFSLIASKRLGNAHESHIVPLPDSDQDILRAGVICGANGAGKSNLLAALRYVRSVALGQRNGSYTTARAPFRFAGLRDQRSTFDLQFVAANKLYRYALSLDDERILEERLTHVVGGRTRLIYLRRTDHSGDVEIDAPGLSNESERLQALVTVGSRHNRSFLATARSVLERNDIGKTLTEVIEWLDDGLALIGPESTLDLSIERLARDGEFRQFASEFLRASATGVDHLRVDKKEISRDEARASRSKELLVERAADGEHFYEITIQATHKSALDEECTLALREESNGTQRLLDLIPALYQPQSGKVVYFIDEVDRSLHPLLVYKFLEYFLRRCTRTPCQIIVTTHEPHLLNLDLLRRDSIWFAEKDSQGATNLYPLMHFNVRKDLHIQKSYLAGRFGAVPLLSEIHGLIGEQVDFREREGDSHEG